MFRGRYGRGRRIRRRLMGAAAVAALACVQLQAEEQLTGAGGKTFFSELRTVTAEIPETENPVEAGGGTEPEETAERTEPAKTEESGAAPESAGTEGGKQSIRITRGDQTLYRNVEDYLPGVVACQLPDGDWETAVWQCQAVIARTCLQSLMGERQCVSEEELALETADGEAVAFGSRYDGEKLAGRLLLAEQAVRTTAGKTLRYGDASIFPLFHAVSAGRTRNGGDDFPYLRSVSCAADSRREDFVSRNFFSWQELAERLGSGAAGGSISAAELAQTAQIAERDGAGYVERMQLGGRSCTGDEIRFLLGLSSAAFSVSESGDGLTFLVRGSGHGYGLSQAYAQTLAESGASWEEILHYFYQDIVITEE